MKPIRLVEILSNIKANAIAFVSIAMFVCLGIGLFVGIQWSSDALRQAAQKEVEAGNLNDVCIQFPYGITKSDLKRLKKVEGVTDVETGYFCFASMIDGSNSHTLKIQTLTKSIDTFTSVKGNLPMGPDEIALLGSWATAHGVSIGDTIALRHDASSAEDPDGMELLSEDAYTVTALVATSAYLFKQSTSYGVSNIGSGSVDCAAFVTKQAFDVDKFQGGYPVVYVRCSELDGLDTFSDAYKEAIMPIAQNITELGSTLGTNRYDDVHGQAQEKIDDAERLVEEGERQLADGERQLADGEQQLADGQRQIEEGEQQLAAGRQELANQQVSGTEKLAEAYRLLSEGQAKYDAGLEQYNSAADVYNQLSTKFDSVRGSYDLLVQLVQDGDANLNAYAERVEAMASVLEAYDEVAGATEGSSQPEQSGEEAWGSVEDAYAGMDGSLLPVKGVLGQLGQPLQSLSGVLGIPLSVNDGSSYSLPTQVTPQNAHEVVDDARRFVNTARAELDHLASATITVQDVTIALMDIPNGLGLMGDKLAETKAQLDAGKAELDARWAEYNAAKAEYDKKVAEGQATIDDGQRKLDESKAAAEQGQKELEDGRTTLEEKAKELEDGKTKLEDGKLQLSKLKQYEWVVMSRLENGGMQGVTTVSNMMLQMRWAMASLFIVVGMFVCYSAVSRLVHEQSVQIGTKKALGFREGEIAFQYLVFSGLAVLLGIATSVLVGIFVVEGIVNPKSYNQFDMTPYGPYFSVANLLTLGGLELALILFATWLAIHGLLKRSALDLLKGESTASAKEHFYERTKLWKHMSLYSQTIVNNCVNDKRRVAGTLVGVIGCTALIVTAVTLSSNVSRSLERHYADVYDHDAVVYLADQSDEYAKAVGMELYNRGVAGTPVFKRVMQVRKPDGFRAVANLVVPTNEDSFNKLYHVISTSGEPAPVDEGGLWVSAAFGEHMGVAPGDDMVITDETGKTHTFRIAGFFDFYLMRHEFVLCQREYREAFGEVPKANALLINTDGVDMDRLRNNLSGVEGYSSLADDKADSSYMFGEIEDILKTTVYIYLALSGLMALMVLLNLDVMFVDEKKRELIVLMINGFSARDAQAYIYRDSLVLTIIGILLGIVVGSIMGGITVLALEPELGHYLKGFNEVAALVGAVGAGAFALAVLFYALRRIPRFDLTDINRF